MSFTKIMATGFVFCLGLVGCGQDRPSGSQTAGITTAGTQANTYGQGGRLFFIRHAETEKNADISDNEEAFSPKGKKQVTELTSELRRRGLRFDQVIVSPMWRARQTIAPFLQQTGYPDKQVAIDDRVKECCWDSRHDNTPAIKEAAAAIRDTLRSGQVQQIVVVGHYHSGRVLLRELTGSDIKLKNAAVNEFTISGFQYEGAASLDAQD